MYYPFIQIKNVFGGSPVLIGERGYAGVERKTNSEGVLRKMGIKVQKGRLERLPIAKWAMPYTPAATCIVGCADLRNAAAMGDEAAGKIAEESCKGY
jgi:hypothetical protein